MHPPQHVCKKVAEANPDYRLGWMGRLPEEDELNPGAFALIHLRGKREVGCVENPLRTFKGQWDVVPIVNEYEQVIGLQRINRGPLFNSCGGLIPDWNPNEVRPLIIQVFDEDLDYRHEDTYSGRIMIVVRAHADRQIYKMRREAARERGRDAERRLSDLGKEMGDYLWHEASKTDQEWMLGTKQGEKEALSKGKFNAFKERGAFRMDDYFLNRMGYKA